VLILDALYDEYRGIVVYLRVLEGTLRVRDQVEELGPQGDGQGGDTGIGPTQSFPYPLFSPWRLVLGRHVEDSRFIQWANLEPCEPLRIFGLESDLEAPFGRPDHARRERLAGYLARPPIMDPPRNVGPLASVT
jgi:hypothetical protein